MVFKINDPMEGKKKRFEDVAHTANHIQCIRCKIDIAEDSIPKKNFIVKYKGKPDKTITEITLMRGSFDDCIGWSF